MIIFAKEPPDHEKQTLKEHLQPLLQKDGWVFNCIYIITFGGFIGLSNFLPTFFYSQFHVTKIQAGQLTVLATIMGSGVRVLGGYLADRLGGIVTLSVVFLAAIAAFLSLSVQPSLSLTTILFMFCFAALGAGNGALFQLVPLRWPLATAVAGSMIGEVGALGGSIIPNAMGFSREYTGSFGMGFISFAGLTMLVLVLLLYAQRGWTKTWVGKGGKALADSHAVAGEVEVDTILA
jgi:NNP family nitrate/nitrite transporter-like MFS transporter